MTTVNPTSASSIAAGTRTQEGTRSRDLVLGVSGVAFAAILLPVLLVPHASLGLGPGTMPEDPGVVTHFFEKHFAAQQAQAIAHSFGAVALLVFFVALASLVRRTTAERVVARLTSAAGAGMATIMLLTMAVVSASISLTGDIDGATQGWMYALGWWAHFKLLYLLPVALVPSCVALRRAKVLPAALAWPGVAVGVLGALSMVGGLSAATEFTMFPVFMLLMAWMTVIGIVSLSRGLATSVR